MLDCGQNKTQNVLFHDLSSLNIDRVIVVCSIYILALAVFVSVSLKAHSRWLLSVDIIPRDCR
ncbi:hypothetical protein ASPVEDRAFT_37956 [Aspergillus versicolor CBS 583.65]|uniref:Uncharacterized protein n=1 Tax=Aspergillus versicolor CBS 583.65 TaxID=1036611 RepID=A0A1L9PAF1_ASPVE|nr:uncharacterized protein ASPVEDRAFT_37956 [Aspergillus versicolor CBS 583.65]OJI98491.1 hypothetical protein ASPVEDRAFT_37956 [Aspergillus versicolor CBS 583.65]